jgi:O-antigen ligase
MDERLSQVNKYIFLIWTLFAFMLSTIVQTLLPFSLNRVLALFIITAVGVYTYLQMTWRDFIVVLYCLFILASTYLISQDKLTNFSDAVYLITAILILNFIQKQNVLEELRQTIRRMDIAVEAVIIVCEIILLISLMDKNCYSAAWGGGKYFLGFCASEHTLASSCSLLLSLILASTVGKTVKWTHMLLMAVPSVCIMASGARTFIIPLLIGLYVYFRRNVKNNVIKLFLLAGAFTALWYLFLHSNMYAKIQYTLNYNRNDILGSLTSGRTNFWAIDLHDFISGDFLQILVGKGFDYVYRLNSAQAGMAIWAHNDIINLLLSVGIIGTAFYCAVLIRFIRLCSKSIFSAMERFLFFLYIFFPMMVNGFYSYPHYLYSVIFLACYVSTGSEVPVPEMKPVRQSKYIKGEIL